MNRASSRLARWRTRRWCWLREHSPTEPVTNWSPSGSPRPRSFDTGAPPDLIERHEDAAPRDGLCLQADFPDLTRTGQGGVCSTLLGADSGITNSGAFFQPPDARGNTDRDAAGVYAAIVNPTVTEKAKVYALRPDGSSTELPSNYLVLDQALLDKVGVEKPAAVLTAELDQATVAAGRRGELEARAVAIGAAGTEIGRQDLIFIPDSCPDQPVKSPPPPPAGSGVDVAPVKPGSDLMRDFNRPFADECPAPLGSSPPKMTAFELSDRLVPASIATAAADDALPLMPATEADYDLAHTSGADLIDVDKAAFSVVRPVTRLLGASTMGKTTIYLARAGDDDRLVYVVSYPVRAVQQGSGWHRLPQPREFFGIVDAATGQVLLRGEAS